jgi:hypothetical protein
MFVVIVAVDFRIYLVTAQTRDWTAIAVLCGIAISVQSVAENEAKR